MFIEILSDGIDFDILNYQVRYLFILHTFDIRLGLSTVSSTSGGGGRLSKVGCFGKGFLDPESFISIVSVFISAPEPSDFLVV